MKNILKIALFSLIFFTFESKALIGGSVARVGQFPGSFQIHRVPEYTKCTGSALTKNHVLLAAHCLFKYGHGIVQEFGLTFFFAYGIQIEARSLADIEAVYLPKETEAFLKKYFTWSTTEIYTSHDVAIIKLRQELPAEIDLISLSKEEIKVGTKFRFGGYGCEKHKSTPSIFDENEHEISKTPRLKYAKGMVTKFTNLVGQGLTYEGLAKQSLCPGDSGGPVYLEKANMKGSFKEIIGINSFHKVKTNGDDVNSENNFTILNQGSKLGKWVQNVIRNKVKPFWSYDWL